MDPTVAETDRLLAPVLSQEASQAGHTSAERHGTFTDSHVATNGDSSNSLVSVIDRQIMPLLFTTYLFNFMDKAILSSAAVFGLREDNHLVSNQYSWVSSAFYFGYFIWTYPTSYFIARLPVGRYLAINTLFWGVVVALTAACSSFTGLMSVRFLLGVAEATVSPALMFITSTWYTRDEIPIRTGIWFAGNSFGGLASSLLAYGMGHIHDEVGPWRWMFIVLGTSTFLWGFVLLSRLPDSISTAEFLTNEQQSLAADRVMTTGTGRTEKTTWKWDQTVECLCDPKTWLIWSIALLCQVPNGGTQNFANIVIKSFGFTSLQSTLINIPYSLLAAGSIAESGYVAGKVRSMNCILVVLVVALPVVGSVLIRSRDQLPHNVSLFGYFLLCTGPSAMPLLMSLVQANYRGVTKKMTMTAMLFIAYCAGNIVGPQLFKADEEPTYDTAFRGIMTCYSLVIVLTVVLRCHLDTANQRREMQETLERNSRLAGDVAGPQRQLKSTDQEDDVTDWAKTGFRYRF